MTAIRDGNGLGKRDDHVVLLTDIRENCPPRDAAADVVVYRVCCAPALVAEVIPGEQGLFEACICIQKGRLASDFAIGIHNTCPNFSKNKVAISSTAWPA